MSILYVRDNAGEFVPIPCIQGIPGKSAYEYATELGYAGSEEDFANDLISIQDKVNKEDGKGLSSEDFTATYKAYLDAAFVQKSGDSNSEPYDITADSLHANNIYSNNKILSSVASDFSFIGIVGSDRTLQTELNEINDSIGDVDTALTNIISLQESYIGGESV